MGIFRRTMTMVAGVIALTIFGLYELAPSGPQQEPADVATASDTGGGSPGGAEVWSHGRDGADENAQEHWRRHGGDFSRDHDAQEYERSAQDFVRNPPPDAEIKHRRNGDTLIYEPSTNTFAVENRDGEPRTYFKPRNGEKYWDRQRDDGR